MCYVEEGGNFDCIVICYVSEIKLLVDLLWCELCCWVVLLVDVLCKMGVELGDCVVLYFLNMLDVIVVFFVMVSVGVIWFVCVFDMGQVVVIDCF